MAYNVRVADNQWHSPSYRDEVNDDFLGQMSTQTPQHPIPTMQGAFEESMLETINEEEEPMPMARKDSVYRRKVLLERPQYERTVAGKWKQRVGEKYHPLWKIVAQISFGMHLLHQGLAKSDEEVMKILQSHVDEVDGFLERTTEDFDLAQHDIDERVRYLNLPLEHGDVFDSMLGDRAFRAAMVEGNIKIEHIIDRTQIALTDSLKDVKKGFDGTRELARYLRKLERTWEARDEEHADVFLAMIGNTEGWSGAFVILQDKGKKLNESLDYLRGIISEIQRLVGIASRRDLPKPYIPKSQASSGPHSKLSSRRPSLSPPRSPQSTHAGLKTAPILKNQAHGDDFRGDRSRQNGASSRSKPQVRYANPTITEPVDARSQLPSRRASLSDRTRQLTSKLSIRSPSKDAAFNGAKSAKAYPQSAVTPKSGPWSDVSKDGERESSSRHRRVQSMISPHTPYDLDYILRVTPSDTGVSPMRDSDLSGLRSATHHLISPMSDVLGPRSAPIPPQSPAKQPNLPPSQPRVKRITTIEENVSGENLGSEPEEGSNHDGQAQSLFREMEATKQQISQAAVVRPLKPKGRELPLRDYDEQKENGTAGEPRDDSKRPNIRASSIYSRTTDLKSMFSPPQSEKENLMALLRANTDLSSVYDTDAPLSGYTEGAMSPPAAISSAIPSPLHFGPTKPTYFSENARNLNVKEEQANEQNEELFPPRITSRKPPSPPTLEKEPESKPETLAPYQSTTTQKATSPSLAALTSATVTGPEPDFPFLSATVNGPEPDFPFDPSPSASNSTENTTAIKHPELVQRIAAATQAESTTSSSPPKASLTTTSSKSSDRPPTAASVERTRRRDVPPNLNLKLFPAPDPHDRAASPRSPRLIDLRPTSPGTIGGGNNRSITPIPAPPAANPNNPPNGTTLLAVPGTSSQRRPSDLDLTGTGASSLAPPFVAGGKQAKSPGWRRVFSPGLLTGKFRSDKGDKESKKGHKRGASSGDSKTRGGNGSNGRITPLIGDPYLTGSTVALPQLGTAGGAGTTLGQGGDRRPSAEAEGGNGAVKRPGGDGKPF